MPDGQSIPATVGTIVTLLTTAVLAFWRGSVVSGTAHKAAIDLLNQTHEREIDRLTVAFKAQFEGVVTQYDARLRVAEAYANEFKNLALKTAGLAEGNLHLAKQQIVKEGG